jgi:hypothetical protein
MSSPSPSRRPFNPVALEPHVEQQKLRSPRTLEAGKRKISIPRGDFVPIIRADVGAAIPIDVYRYRILVPIAEILDETVRPIPAGDVWTTIAALRVMFVRHFGGCTILMQDPSPLRGVGARDPQRPDATLEENAHVAFEVLAAPIHASDEYFHAVRRELQEVLQEGVILIERQHVTLI